VDDSFWVPPPGWKPGDPVSPEARALEVQKQVEELTGELDVIKSSAGRYYAAIRRRRPIRRRHGKTPPAAGYRRQGELHELGAAGPRHLRQPQASSADDLYPFQETADDVIGRWSCV